MVPRILLFVFFLAIAVNAVQAADDPWILLTREAAQDVYYDRGFKTLETDEIHVRILVDYRSNQMGILSKQSDLKLSCQNNTFTEIANTLYEGNLATGESYSSKNATNTVTTVSDKSPLTMLFRKICKPTPN
jgi:predicted RNA methylase